MASAARLARLKRLAIPNAWFVAYYPAEAPRIAFAGVMANSREGSEVVAPMIRRILDEVEGVRRAPFPAFWGEPYNPLPSQSEALANYDPIKLNRRSSRGGSCLASSAAV